jgi:hypothetical protein
MPIKPPSPRHIVEHNEDYVQVILPSKKNYFHIAWHGLWILMWLFITGSALIFAPIFVLPFIADIFSNSGNVSPGSIGAVIFVVLFFTVFFVFLFGMGSVAIYSFFWQIVGKEIIQVNNEVMRVSRHIFRWKRVSEYAIESVLDLRVSIPHQSYFGFFQNFKKLLGKNGLIALDYGAKTFRFGLEIEEAEAKQIVSVLQQRYPQTPE